PLTGLPITHHLSAQQTEQICVACQTAVRWLNYQDGFLALIGFERNGSTGALTSGPISRLNLGEPVQFNGVLVNPSVPVLVDETTICMEVDSALGELI